GRAHLLGHVASVQPRWLPVHRSTRLTFLFPLRAPTTPQTHPLSLHDALPIYQRKTDKIPSGYGDAVRYRVIVPPNAVYSIRWNEDRKSTRLNSSHVKTSYAVFCLKKKTPTSGKTADTTQSLPFA